MNVWSQSNNINNSLFPCTSHSSLIWCSIFLAISVYQTSERFTRLSIRLPDFQSFYQTFNFHFRVFGKQIGHQVIYSKLICKFWTKLRYCSQINWNWSKSLHYLSKCMLLLKYCRHLDIASGQEVRELCDIARRNIVQLLTNILQRMGN